MNWIPLTEHNEELWRGAVFRVWPTTEYPYERPVDFMLVESFEAPSRLALMVATGYKSGSHPRPLPLEARVSEKSHSISPAWLVENWHKQVYPDCKVEEILVSDGYQPGMP